MVEPADVEGAVEAAVKKGQYPDRKAASAAMAKQLVALQRGALQGKLAIDPVAGPERQREELWKSLLAQAGGDEERAARLYLEELKKLGEAGP